MQRNLSQVQGDKGKEDGLLVHAGRKEMTTCDIYIKWEGLWCPCCGYMLRNRPKGNQYKQRHRENARV
ncbi:MAG: hypothetical protein GKS07_10025 [Nitrosopumilus sp.]|nr:MAG: hypothetical protein GKS07_10025 [Nitrosopumilus sp.]